MIHYIRAEIDLIKVKKQIIQTQKFSQKQIQKQIQMQMQIN
jgi:hypothetical protein